MIINIFYKSLKLNNYNYLENQNVINYFITSNNIYTFINLDEKEIYISPELFKSKMKYKNQI